MIRQRMVLLILLTLLGFLTLRGIKGSPSCPPTCLGEKLGAVNWDRRNRIGAVMIDAVARHASMENVDFSGADLTGFDLFGGNLKGINLTAADLIGADLGGTYLSGAVFNETDLTGVNLTKADLTGASLTHSRLTAANFNNTRLVNADLSLLDLSGAYMNDSRLSGSNLNRIKFSGGVLDRVDFSGADLRYADLRGAWINLSTLAGADLHGADLSGVSLIGSDLTGCDLSDASLAGANLVGALLRGANLSGADLSAAQLVATPELLDRTLLNDDIFRTLSVTQWEELNLGDAVLDGAIQNQFTRWPQGFEPPPGVIFASNSETTTDERSGETLVAVAGSRSVYVPAGALARGYMREHPEVFFNFMVTDSTDGIAQVGNGAMSIGMSSRRPTAQEIALYPDLRFFPIGQDAVSVVVNPQNAVSDLSLDQLRMVLLGEITNWSMVGGPNLEITVLSQSDTMIDFVTVDILGGAMIPEGLAETLPSHAAVRAETAQDRSAIGLLPMHLADRSVKEVAIEGILPGPGSVLSGDYPLIRNFYLITRGEPDKEAGGWMVFIHSEAGRSLVEQEGLVPAQHE